MNTQTIFVILVSAYTYYFMDTVLRSNPKDGALTKSEKIQVIILLILNTLISWAILSFGWKKKLPIKSKHVNKYLKIILVSLVVIAIIAVFITIILSATIRKSHGQ
ncbi:MAG: hypothetical protein NUV65_00650 [Candidatus Roizmanbacteria bacterium]|nr:hypothetical protein [Candidatus Roizmanbacteria bacterium]